MQHRHQMPKRKNVIIWFALGILGVIVLINFIYKYSPSTSARSAAVSTENSKSDASKKDKNHSEFETEKEALAKVTPALPLGKLIATVPGNQKVVYLTFDDGPGRYTKEITSILDKEGIKASFFWVGKNVTDSLGQYGHEMVKKGDVIGTHTMQHTSLSHKSEEEQIELITTSAQYIANKIKDPIYYFRPPYGAVDKNTKQASLLTKLPLVYWEGDSVDWKYQKKPQMILENVEKGLKPGAIILLHEKKETTALLPSLIQMIKAKGYAFASLPTPKIQ